MDVDTLTKLKCQVSYMIFYNLVWDFECTILLQLTLFVLHIEWLVVCILSSIFRSFPDWLLRISNKKQICKYVRFYIIKYVCRRDFKSPSLALLSSWIEKWSLHKLLIEENLKQEALFDYISRWGNALLFNLHQ